MAENRIRFGSWHNALNFSKSESFPLLASWIRKRNAMEQIQSIKTPRLFNHWNENVNGQTKDFRKSIYFDGGITASVV